MQNIYFHFSTDYQSERDSSGGGDGKKIQLKND